MFSDYDSECNDLIIGDYMVEGSCIDGMELHCNSDGSEITATKYSNNDCSGTQVGNQTYPTGQCTSSTSLFECTNAIELPQDQNYIMNVRYIPTNPNDCSDYKDGFVTLNYVPTACQVNVEYPRTSYTQQCNSTTITSVSFNGHVCDPSKQTGQVYYQQLPVSNCINSTNYYSSYQFCYQPSF